MHRFLVLIASLFLVSTSVFAQPDACNEQSCIAIVDAGSTGSRIHIYAYDNDTTGSPINIIEIWSKKIRPGFATIEANSYTIDAYLNTLFVGSPAANMPLYFYATAGMRLLPPAKQKIYYSEMKKWFANQDKWQLMSAKTITGTQEALYDWLSVNYRLGTLQSVQNRSVGVMDMGGASVQIVFPVKKGQNDEQKTLAEFDLYGQHLALSVHSFLGLGQTEMSHQFLNSSACFPQGFPLPDEEAGQGDAYICENEVASLMNAVHKVDRRIKPLLAENPVDTWYSIGGISNLASSNVFNFDNNQLTSQKLLDQADKHVCHQSWDIVNNQYPNEEFMYEYCLFSAYYYALMVDGYGIQPDETINFLPADQNIDWTIGVVLYH